MASTMDNKSIFKNVLSIALIGFICLGFKISSYAVGVDVTFGSSSYTKELGEQFPVGIWLNSDGPIGDYHVEVLFDSESLRYEWGADSWDVNYFTVHGSSDRNEVGYLVYFSALKSGDTTLTLSNVSVNDSQGNAVDTTVMNPVTIHIWGKMDSENASSEVNENEHGDDDIETGNEAPHNEDDDREKKSDETENIADVTDYSEVINDTKIEKTIETNVIVSTDESITLTILLDESGRKKCYVSKIDEEDEYPAFETIINNQIYYCFTPYIMETWPDGMTNEIVREDGIYCYMNESGDISFLKYDSGGSKSYVGWNENIHDLSEKRLGETEKLILLVLIVALAVCILFVIGRSLLLSKRSGFYVAKEDIIDNWDFNMEDNKKERV